MGDQEPNKEPSWDDAFAIAIGAAVIVVILYLAFVWALP